MAVRPDDEDETDLEEQDRRAAQGEPFTGGPSARPRNDIALESQQQLYPDAASTSNRASVKQARATDTPPPTRAHPCLKLKTA